MKRRNFIIMMAGAPAAASVCASNGVRMPCGVPRRAPMSAPTISEGNAELPEGLTIETLMEVQDMFANTPAFPRNGKTFVIIDGAEVRAEFKRGELIDCEIIQKAFS